MAGGDHPFHLETGVWWDMNTCPVPPGFDPRHVRGCIKSALEKKIGRPSVVSIYALGNLEYIPRDLLEMISSSGITLIHGLRNMMDFNGFLEEWSDNSMDTTYTMVITDDYGIAYPPLLGLFEFSKLCAYPKDGRLIALANQSNPRHRVLPCDFVWEALLSDNYADTTDEMNSTRSKPLYGSKPLYVCNICDTYFEEEFSPHLKFSTHLKGEGHRTKRLETPATVSLNIFAKFAIIPPTSILTYASITKVKNISWLRKRLKKRTIARAGTEVQSGIRLAR
ncbi:zinc finger protein-related [Raphanus sativus]|nr:zinc finger protein-related [Raphanus sativus]